MEKYVVEVEYKLESSDGIRRHRKMKFDGVTNLNEECIGEAVGEAILIGVMNSLREDGLCEQCLSEAAQNAVKDVLVAN